tara:strand:+ start:293 stop:505 length:213 start_codon:yes stop_codon:yes gene_type:complete
MGKVKQSIQEVEEEVSSIVKLSLNKLPISLPDLQTLLFKKYWYKDDNGFFLNEDVVIKAYNKALEELENE